MCLRIWDASVVVNTVDKDPFHTHLHSESYMAVQTYLYHTIARVRESKRKTDDKTSFFKWIFNGSYEYKTRNMTSSFPLNKIPFFPTFGLIQVT